MEILTNIVIGYFVVFIIIVAFLMFDDHNTIRKYGKHTFNKFSPYSYKHYMVIASVWPFLAVFGIYIFIKHYFIGNKDTNEKNK